MGGSGGKGSQISSRQIIIVDTEGVFISTVNFNPEFWSSVLPKLEAFYNEHILVELAYPRVKFGLSRLDLRGC